MKTKDFHVWLLLVFFSLAYASWSVVKHNRFQTSAVDLALFDQPLWHYSRGEAPYSTVKYNSVPGAHILGDHFHPTLALLSPLYWLWDDVRVILVAQAVLAVLSAWPIYQIARLKLGHKFFSLSLTFSYLTFLGFQTALDYDFHEVAVAILPFSLALYYLITNNLIGYVISAVLAALTKEDMPLFIAFLGIFSLVRLRKVKLGGLTVLFGFTLYFVVTQFLIPHFKGDRFAYEELDPRLGKTSFDLLKTAALNPWLVLNVLFFPFLKTKTMLNLLASFAFLPLLSPITLLLAIPNLAGRFLTRLPQRWLIRYQYGINVTPILAAAVIFGLEDLKKVGFLRRRFDTILKVSSFLLIAAPLLQTYRVNGPLLRIFNPDSYRPEKRFEVNYALLNRIPKDVDVSVMAQSSFVPHLSHRRVIFRYEDGLIDKAGPDYVLMSADEASDPPYVRQDLEAKIEILRQNPAYEVEYWDGVRLLLKRRGVLE